MGSVTRTCGCGAEISNWRSCPIKGCKVETVFCDSCGGDPASVDKMKEHIKSHSKEVQSV